MDRGVMYPAYNRVQIKFKDVILDVLASELSVEDDQMGGGKRYTLIVNERMPRIKFPAENVEPKNLAREPHMMNTIEYEYDKAVNRATGLGPGTYDQQRDFYELVRMYMEQHPPSLIAPVLKTREQKRGS